MYEIAQVKINIRIVYACVFSKVLRDYTGYFFELARVLKQKSDQRKLKPNESASKWLKGPGLC